MIPACFRPLYSALLVVLGAYALLFAPQSASAQTSPQGRVIVVTVDGLRPDVIQEYGAESLPGFQRLMKEGACTLNARTDPEYVLTIPNHTTMYTGLKVGGLSGHNFWYNRDIVEGETIHQQKGSYVASFFDVAHDHGGRTGLFSSKSRFTLFDQSWDVTNGAVDVTGADNGRDKIDISVYHPTSSTTLLHAFRSESATKPFHLAAFHIGETDDAGHSNDWNTDEESAYGMAVRLADTVIHEILHEIESNPAYAGRTHLIVLSDHGGMESGHWDAESPENYTVPFMVWGPDVEPGDLYALNPSRTDPGSSHLSYDQAASEPPVQIGDVANLALSLIGLPAVPGSRINADQSLRVRRGEDGPGNDPDLPDGASVTVAFQDGAAPTKGYNGTRDTKLMSDAPATAFGSAPTLEMDGAPAYRSLMAWDLSAIPDRATILSAEIVLDVTNVSSDTYGLFAMTRKWSESHATWEQASASAQWTEAGAASSADRSLNPVATVVPSVLGTTRLSLNAEGLALLQSWIKDPSTNHGFLIETTNHGYDGMDVSSSEASDPAVRPKLMLTYSTQAGTTPNQPPVASISATSTGGLTVFLDGSDSSDSDGSVVSWSWTLGNDGTALGEQISHTWSEPGTYSVTLTVTDNEGATGSTQQTINATDPNVGSHSFQDGLFPTAGYAGTRDTKIWSDRPVTMFGADPELEADGDPEASILMAWDVSVIKPGTEIRSASITLNITNPTNDSYEVYAMNRPWEEGMATWYDATRTKNWTVEGVTSEQDRDTKVLGSVGSQTTGMQTFELNQAGVQLIEQWISDPSSNHGIILQDYDNAWDGLDFSSREAGDPALRPRLTIETGSNVAERVATISSDSGAEVAWSPTGELSFSPGAPWSDAFQTLKTDYPALHPVQTGAAGGDELRISTSRSMTAIVMSPTSDSTQARQRRPGFVRERTAESGSSSWDIWVRVIPGGSHVVNLAADEALLLQGDDPKALGVQVEPVDLPSQSTLAAYPNPFQDEIRLDYDDAAPRTVELVDMAGRRVLRQDISGEDVRLDTRTVSAGTYVLRVFNTNGKTTSRMVTRL